MGIGPIERNGDRCVSCATQLSTDQRYCVNCGERRGAARFSLPPASTATETERTPPPSKRSRRPRFSSGATLVAGIGTLLLAMGVGVLIGHQSASNSTKQANVPQQIHVNVGGGAAATTPTTAASTGAGSGSSKKSKAGKGKHGGKSKSAGSKGSAPSAAAASAASSAAKKVLGSNANVPPPTVTVGQKGSGPGYSKKTGKFNGTFFGN